jgi:hypothetical protein
MDRRYGPLIESVVLWTNTSGLDGTTGRLSPGGGRGCAGLAGPRSNCSGTAYTTEPVCRMRCTRGRRAGPHTC